MGEKRHLRHFLPRVDAVPSTSPLMVLQFPEGKSLLTIDWIGVLARWGMDVSSNAS